MIQIKNLSKNFGSTTAVDNVSLTIGKGELFGLLGPNGAGKSTLINIMTGLLSPDSGTVSFNGFDGAKSVHDIRRILGLVPQDLSFYLNYSAMENVRFFASLYGLSRKALTVAAQAAREFAGLSDTVRKPARTF